jgi:hypothetical protein
VRTFAVFTNAKCEHAMLHLEPSNAAARAHMGPDRANPARDMSHSTNYFNTSRARVRATKACFGVSKMDRRRGIRDERP